MNLQLALDQTGLTWTLNDNQVQGYKVGNQSGCDILLTHVGIGSEFRLEFSYNSSTDKWHVRKLNGTNNTFINRQILTDEPSQIHGKTRINVADILVLFAIPIVSKQLAISRTEQSNPSLTSTRLLSGYAYINGLFTGLELLTYLRSHKYQAKIPSSSLNLDQISTHAIQSVLISVLFAVLAIIILIIQFLILQIFGSNQYSFFVIGILALIAAFATAFELIYLRWLLARKFLRKNYSGENTLKFLKFLEPTVRYFKQKSYQDEPSQNIITFAGSNPFVGYGELIPNSSWTVPIERKIVETDELPENNIKQIPAYEFYQAVDQELKRLNLPNLENLSRLFVDGFELDTDSKIIDTQTTVPATISLDNPLMWTDEASSVGSKQRAYRLYQYVDKERDYVLSHFLRFYNAGSITFVESSAYILTGIDRQRFSLTSTLDHSHLCKIIKMLLAVVLILPVFYVVVPAVAFWYISIFVFNVVSWYLNDIKQRRMAESQEEYQYGVEQTLREYVAEPLNLSQKRNLTRSFGNLNQGFKRNWNLKSVIRNPILLLVLMPIIIPVSSVLIYIKFVLKYLQSERSLKINFDYYGSQDVFMYWKAIQDAIVNGTIKVLKRHGIDTSNFEQKATGIVNNGVIITADTITNSQIAGGASSNVSQTQQTSK